MKNLYWLYNPPDWTTLHQVITGHIKKNRLQLKCFVLLADDNLDNLLESKKSIGYKIEKFFTSEDSTIYSYKLKSEFKLDLFEGSFSIIKQCEDNIWLVITHEDMSFVNKHLIKYLNNLYPHVSRIFLTSRQIRTIIENIEREFKYKINSEFFVAKRYYRDNAGKTKATRLDYSNETYDNAFNKASKEGVWVDKIIINFMNTESNFRVYISRSGVIKCLEGDFIRVYENILRQVIEKAFEEYNIYKDRWRIKEEKYGVKPLIMHFFNDAIKDLESIDDFTRVVKGYPNSEITVFSTKPFAYISITDFRDGSSFDISSINTKEIMLIPQFRASYSALMRFCDFVFTHFYEGEVYKMEAKNASN